MNIVLVTVSPSAAEELASYLIHQKLVACVNFVDKVKSFYWWQGSIEKDEEILMLIKTSKYLRDRIEQVIKERHPYEVPEIVFIEVVHVNKDYKKWIIESVESVGTVVGLKDVTTVEEGGIYKICHVLDGNDAQILVNNIDLRKDKEVLRVGHALFQKTDKAENFRSLNSAEVKLNDTVEWR